MRPEDPFELFDKIFEELESIPLEKTVSTVGKQVKKTIRHTIKEKGYDDLGSLISDSMRDKKAKKPYPIQLYVMNTKYKNRYEYMKEALSCIRYDGNYRGYYKEGHEVAISTTLSYMSEYPEDVLRVEEYIQYSIKNYKEHHADDLYTEGYIDGLLLYAEIMEQAKKSLMDCVKKSIASTKSA